MRPPRDNNPAEMAAFTTVCDRLGGFDDRIAPEWIDGYITALASGPRLPALDDWLPRAAGDAFERAFADPDDRAQAERALRARQAVIADQLDAEALDADFSLLRLWPLMSEWDDAARAALIAEEALDADAAASHVTGALWADGFLAALQDHRVSHVADDDADFALLVGAVAALRLPAGSDALREHLRKAYDSDDVARETLIDDACYAVQDMRLWWVDHAPVPETRRVAPTPGRNDPCPCGSGRKFKKCHGA